MKILATSAMTPDLVFVQREKAGDKHSDDRPFFTSKLLTECRDAYHGECDGLVVRMMNTYQSCPSWHAKMDITTCNMYVVVAAEVIVVI